MPNVYDAIENFYTNDSGWEMVLPQEDGTWGGMAWMTRPCSISGNSW